MVDECFEMPSGDTPVPPAITAHVPNDQNGPSCSTSMAQDAPLASNSSTSSYIQSPSVHQGTAFDESFEVNPYAPPDVAPFKDTFAPESSSKASSSGDLNTSTSVSYPQPHDLHFNGNSTQPVFTRRHLDTLALWCSHNSIQFYRL